MKIDITRHGFGLTVLVFFAFLALLFSVEPALEPKVMIGAGLPLGGVIYALDQWSPEFATVLLVVVVFVSSLLLAIFTSRNMIHFEKTYLPITLYLFTGVAMLCSAHYLNVFIAALLVIYSINIISGTFSRFGTASGIFNASLFVGLAPLFYAPSVVFVLSLPVALAMHRSDVRMWIVSLCGVLLPVAVCSYVEWAIGDGFWLAVNEMWTDIISPSTVSWSLPVSYIMLIALIVVMIIWSTVVCARTWNSTRPRAIKAISYNYWQLAISLLMFALPSRSIEMMAFVAIPVSVLLPAIFMRGGSRLASNVLYLVLILAVIAVSV